jgi:hypothetical protein
MQITRLTRQRASLDHEDELEALANVAGLWTQDMDIDPSQAIRQRADAAVEAHFRQRAERCGIRIPEPAWFQHH